MIWVLQFDFLYVFVSYVGDEGVCCGVDDAIAQVVLWRNEPHDPHYTVSPESCGRNHLAGKDQNRGNARHQEIEVDRKSLSSRLSVEHVRSAIGVRNNGPRIDEQKQMEVLVLQVEGLDQKPGAHARQVGFDDVEYIVREPIRHIINTTNPLKVEKAPFLFMHYPRHNRCWNESKRYTGTESDENAVGVSLVAPVPRRLWERHVAYLELQILSSGG